jgi:uncharacterized MAPEG superfamily protein
VDTLSPDLYWLAATAVMTMLMWMPHILWLIIQEGLGKALMDGNHVLQVKPMWAKRSQKAHDNAAATLAAFAVLVLVAHIVGADVEVIGQLAMIYFILRALHYLVYVLGLPVIRTVIYLMSVGIQIMIAVHIFG